MPALGCFKLGLRQQGFYEECQHSNRESLVGFTDLEPREISPSMAAIVGFPMRALRDPSLTIEDLRVLICAGVLTAASGKCVEDIDWIARQAELSPQDALERLERLASRGYVRRQREGGATVLCLMPDTDYSTEPPSLPPPPNKARSSPRRDSGRSAQASLHSGMLRRPARRQSGAIDFDDPLPAHPVVASLQESVQSASGGVDGFRFWLKTILDPEDVEIFSGWAGRQSTEYRKLVSKFDSADDDHTIESLLEDTLALVNREKRPNR